MYVRQRDTNIMRTTPKDGRETKNMIKSKYKLKKLIMSELDAKLNSKIKFEKEFRA